MKMLVINVLLGVAGLMLAACGSPGTNTTADTSLSLAQVNTAAPTADTLLALDKQASEAYIKGDSEFFEGMLSDKFVMHEGGTRLDKATAIKMIAGNKCNVKEWKLDEPQMAKIDVDTYVLSYKSTFDGSCTGPDGKSKKIPSPTRAATVWVRSGDKWLAAYHGENLIIDPKNPPSTAKAESKQPKKGDKAAANSNGATKPAADPRLTDELIRVEKKIWEAWMAKDGKKLEALTTNDLSFQNIFGTHFSNKTETIKDWTGPACNVKSVSVADGAGTLISPSVAILTSKGTAEGACGGQKLTRIRVYGTSVYIKDGDTWKLAFCLNRPLD